MGEAKVKQRLQAQFATQTAADLAAGFQAIFDEGGGAGQLEVYLPGDLSELVVRMLITDIEPLRARLLGVVEALQFVDGPGEQRPLCLTCDAMPSLPEIGAVACLSSACDAAGRSPTRAMVNVICRGCTARLAEDRAAILAAVQAYYRHNVPDIRALDGIANQSGTA